MRLERRWDALLKFPTILKVSDYFVSAEAHPSILTAKKSFVRLIQRDRLPVHCVRDRLGLVRSTYLYRNLPQDGLHGAIDWSVVVNACVLVLVSVVGIWGNVMLAGRARRDKRSMAVDERRLLATEDFGGP